MKTFKIITRSNTITEEITPAVHTTIEENRIRKEYVFQGEDIEVSDEYHTMHELYQHRMALNIALFKMMFKLDEQIRGKESWTNPNIMRSELHHDGTMFDGYFIVFANTAAGQISYHYKLKHWNKFNFLPIIHKIPIPWDGHDSKETIERLMKL